MGFFDIFRSSKKEATLLVSNIAKENIDSRLISSTQYLDQIEGWAYRAMELISNAVVEYQPTLIDQNEEVVKNSIILKDLYRFNSFIGFSQSRKLTIDHLTLTGMAYWIVFDHREDGHRFEFYNLDPNNVYLNTNSYGEPDYYTFKDKLGQPHRVELNQLIVFRKADPKNWLKGLSSLQAGRYYHNQLELGAKYNMNALNNNGRPDGFLVFPGINDDLRTRLQEQLEQNYSGVENAKKLGVLNTNVDFVEISKSQRDIDFIEGMKEARDSLLSIMGVPKTLVGLSDSTYANSAEAIRIFQRYTLQPLLNLEAEILTRQLLPMYNVRQDQFKFLSKDAVESDKKIDAEVASTLYQSNIITQNEARKLVGLQEDTNDTGYINEIATTGKSIIKSVENIEEKITDLKSEIKTKALNEKREKLRDYFYERDIEQEKILQSGVIELFNSQKKRFINEIDNQTKSVLKTKIDWEQEDKIAIEIIYPFLDTVGRNYYNDAVSMIQDIPQYTEVVRDSMQKHLFKFIPEINATTKKKFVKILADAVANDLSTEDAKKEVIKLFDGFISNGRAERIARTESTRAKGYVQRDTYFKSKFVERVEWLSARDQDTRDTHRNADGQKTFKGMKFRVGDSFLAYPGDPSAPARETVNCRCTLIPVID